MNEASVEIPAGTIPGVTGYTLAELDEIWAAMVDCPDAYADLACRLACMAVGLAGLLADLRGALTEARAELALRNVRRDMMRVMTSRINGAESERDEIALKAHKLLKERDAALAAWTEAHAAWTEARVENARLREARDALDARIVELAWAEMLAGQSCPVGKHSDWFVDSDYNHLCPWCSLDTAHALLARARPRIRHDHAYPMEIIDAEHPHYCPGCAIEADIDAAIGPRE